MFSNSMLRFLKSFICVEFFFLSFIICSSAGSCDLPSTDPDTAYTEAVNYLTANGTHIVNVCLYQVTPIGICNPVQGEITYGNATGFLPDLFTQLANYIGLFSGQYNFSCWYDSDALVYDIVHSLGQCDVSVADLDVRPALVLKGVRFPLALYSQGLQIVSPTYIAGSSLWEFFFPFTWQLWLVWVVTIFFAASTLFAMERTAIGETDLIGRPGFKGWMRANWYVCGQAVGVVSIEALESFGARIFGLAFGFLMLVLVALFTANMAAFVTTRKKLTRVTSLSDIAGKVVATYENYSGIFEAYNPSKLLYLPWNNQEDELNMANGLLNGTFDALIIDSPFASYISSQYCGFACVGEPMFEEFLSMALPPSAPMWISLTLENALVAMQLQNQIIDQLVAQYLDVPDTCDGQKIVASVQVDFESIAGLWIILGIGIGLGVLTTIYAMFHGHKFSVQQSEPATGIKKKLSRQLTKSLSWVRGYLEPDDAQPATPMEADDKTTCVECVAEEAVNELSQEQRVELVEALMKLTLELALPEQRGRVEQNAKQLLANFQVMDDKT